MPNCPVCKEELPERGSHCRKCGFRAKCGNCRELLEVGDVFCVECGAPVDAPTQTNGSIAIDKADGNFNVITYEEDVRSRKFQAKLSDNAIESGSDVLAMLMAQRMGQQVKRNRQMNSSEDFIDNGNSVDVEPVEDENLIQPVRKTLPAGNSDIQRLKDVFEDRDGVLLPIENRLKQKNTRDYVRRLTVLFLYAHEINGRDRVPRSAVTALLEAAKLNDGNARSWILSGEMTVSVGDDIRLNNAGREVAPKFVAELDDNSIIDIKVSTVKKSRGVKADAGEESEKVTKKRVRGTSYRALITKLIEEGWLKDRKTGKDIQTELDRQGSKFPMHRINSALQDFTLRKILDREKVGEEWHYWKR